MYSLTRRPIASPDTEGARWTVSANGQAIGFAADEVRATLDAVGEIVEVVEPDCRVSLIQAKESDNRILECALEAKVDVIVTGNMKHIRPLGSIQGIAILTPREFLDKYFPLT